MLDRLAGDDRDVAVANTGGAQIVDGMERCRRQRGGEARSGGETEFRRA
jgi:hypothetical protein